MTMRMSAVRLRVAHLSGTIAALGVLAVPLIAQDRGAGDDCRCVDRNGEEIRGCTCLRTVDPQQIVTRIFTGRSSRARLGITVNPAQADEDNALGAKVLGVLEDGPAAESGIRVGDVITRLDGKSLLSPIDREGEEALDLDQSIPVQRLLSIAGELDPGRQVQVEYLRDGERHTATVETEDLSGRAAGVFSFPLGSSTGAGLAFPNIERRFNPSFGWSWSAGDSAVSVSFGGDRVGGISLVELNPELGSYFGTEEGVLVTEVRAGSPLGLLPGDVILEVGEHDATSADQVRRILRSYEDDEAIALRIRRRGKEMDILGRLSTR